MKTFSLKFFLFAAGLGLILGCEDEPSPNKNSMGKLRIEFNLTSSGERVLLNEITSLPNGYDIISIHF